MAGTERGGRAWLTLGLMSALYFMRSAIAPTISAGVMMANISWYIANTSCETQCE